MSNNLHNLNTVIGHRRTVVRPAANTLYAYGFNIIVTDDINGTYVWQGALQAGKKVYEYDDGSKVFRLSFSAGRWYVSYGDPIAVNLAENASPNPTNPSWTENGTVSTTPGP